MLEVRLPSNIEIGPPLFEEEIREEEENLMEQQAKMGGKALLEIFGLEINEGQIEILRDEILDAVYKKVTRQEEAPPNSLLEAVIRYDRQDQPTFPSTPIGSCYDYLEVLKRHLRRRYKEGEISEEAGKQMREVFEEASSTLRDMGRHKKPYVAIQDEQFGESLDRLEELTPLESDRFPPEAAVLFLDLRDQLREDDNIEETSVYEWKNALQENGKERALAIGLWMIGAFFDFSTFADTYYESKNANFLSGEKSTRAA